MVLLEALKSPAFYTGALGSRGNTTERREWVALFDLSPSEIDRLHGPVGLDIGAKTPAEIAVSIVAAKNGVSPRQKKEGSAFRRCKRFAPRNSQPLPGRSRRRFPSRPGRLGILLTRGPRGPARRFPKRGPILDHGFAPAGESDGRSDECRC
jgi:hypothetical protein